MTFEKFTCMNSQVLPQLLAFAKRKNAKAEEAHLYVKIKYGKESHEKSLGFKCLYKDWNSQDLLLDYSI